MTRLAGFGAIAALVLLAGALPAEAQQKTLTVAAYGGVWDSATLRKEVFPEFEKKHGVKVEYVAGNSTDTLAKLQAQKGNQVIDVAIMDDGVMYQAIKLGFCAQIQGLDKSELYPAALFKDDKAVAVGQTGTGFMINTKVFKERGWPIATSWNDLKDAEVQEAAGDPADQQHLRGSIRLMMFARMNGGGERRTSSPASR
jgi:putative spermidine/putrescine transport system substrate-binding protein